MKRRTACRQELIHGTNPVQVPYLVFSPDPWRPLVLRSDALAIATLDEGIRTNIAISISISIRISMSISLSLALMTTLVDF